MDIKVIYRLDSHCDRCGWCGICGSFMDLAQAFGLGWFSVFELDEIDIPNGFSKPATEIQMEIRS